MHLKLSLCLLMGLCLSACLSAQEPSAEKMMDQTISVKSTTSLLSTLAADDMEGRKFGTPGIRKAAAVIAAEFKKAGLQTIPGDSGYYQHFTMVSSKIKEKTVKVNGQILKEDHSLIISSQPEINIDAQSGYKVLTADSQAEFMKLYRSRQHPSDNALIVLDRSLLKLLPRLKRMQQNQFQTPYSTIYIVSQDKPTDYSLKATNELTTIHLANMVGILPGKTKPNERVIFSGHYDHLGIDPNNKTDSIFNGANDDASGTTAVIQLAKYYAKLGNNDRTLVFAAFTAEEAGGFGSTYFSNQFDPVTVMAMFNIEMIGTDSKWGTNSAYITGFEKTDMGKILQANLKGTDFSFHPDPYTDQHLFYRSDNATLARQGVPAHTISTSKMDAEPNYHKVSDEVSTLNLSNMNNIIRSIAFSAGSIISGKDTPSRVDTTTLD